MNNRLITSMIKDALHLDMVSVYNDIVEKHDISRFKSNNSYFMVDETELDRDHLIETLVDIIRKQIKKCGTEVRKTSGCGIESICAFVDDDTIDIFFDISTEENHMIMVTEA